MEKKKHPQSMSEVAKELGLSRATVSYIINDRYRNYNISEATAERVREYIRKSGFTPNIFSLALKGKLNKDIAILMPPTGLQAHQKSAFFSMLRQIHENNLNYIVLPSSKRRYQDIVQQLKTYRLRKAVVICANLSSDENLEFWQMIFKNLPDVRWCFYEFPFGRVEVDKFTGGHDVSCVGIDRGQSFLEVIKYIASMGYRKIILPSQPSDENVELIESLGMQSIYLRYILSTVSSYETGYQFGKLLVEKIDELKGAAVYINDDIVSIGAIDCLLEHQCKVPEDIAFLSWDALEESQYFQVPLTSMEIPHNKMIEATLQWAFADDSELKHLPSEYKFDIEVRPGKSLPPKQS